MMNRRHTSSPATRRGLAPLEFTLALPLLLLLMGLMINFGTATTWKLRGATAARDAGWRSRYPRAGGTYPQPTNWPAPTATISSSGANDLNDIDDAVLDAHPAVMGPTYNQIEVNGDRLRLSRSVRAGHADITKTHTLIRALGSYAYSLTQPLVDNSLEYSRTGQSANTQRRLPSIYTLPRDDGLRESFTTALWDLVYATFWPQLAVLDKDDEFRADRGSAPDFHPRPTSFCSIDRASIDQTIVKRLIDQIQGKCPPGKVASVAETMTSAFLSMYKSQKADLEAQMPPGNTAVVDALIAQLEAFKAQLDALCTMAMP